MKGGLASYESGWGLDKYREHLGLEQDHGANFTYKEGNLKFVGCVQRIFITVHLNIQ